MRGIHKRFGATVALAGADLELAAGEIHALLGENGAGKTTLVQVLYGLVQPDAGEIRLGGAPVRMGSPRAALAHGIGLVAQHFALIPALSVAENLALGDPSAPAAPRALQRWAQERLERAGLRLDPALPSGELAVGQKQRLEMARALARGARVLVLDEPTAVLAPPEVEQLLELLPELRAQGHSIVFISHKLAEVTRVCDRVTVLRAGRSVGTRAARGASAAELSRWMLGEAAALPPPAPPDAVRGSGTVALRARGLRCPGLGPLELELAAGELAAIAGIDGNGQQALEELLAGVRVPSSGALELLRPPLALLPGDRQRTALVLELSLAENLALPAAARGGDAPPYRRGWLQRGALAARAQAALAPLGVAASLAAPARSLSGGNQQKLALARALQDEAGVLVAVQPTRGLDIASAARVRALLRERARAGAAVLLISTDLDEVLELAERVWVLFRGELRPLAAGPRRRERAGELMLGAGA